MPARDGDTTLVTHGGGRDADAGSAASGGEVAGPAATVSTRRAHARNAALLAAFVAGGAAHAVGGLLRVPGIAPPAAQQLVQELVARRERALRDYLEAEDAELREVSPRVFREATDHLAGTAPGVALSRLPPPAAPGRVQAASEALVRPAARRPAARGVVEHAERPGADPAYERLYGSASRYAAAARAPLQAGAGPQAGAARGRTVGRGVVLQARVANELASQPAYGTAIASLTAPGKFGNTTLPVGTQVHGTVRGSGNSDTRLFVDFQFARLASGETFALQATASDRQGREGIPGRRDLSRAAAGSVALSAASRAGEAAGRTLAGSLGSIMGAGVEGATASTSDKVGRLDRDDPVVLVARGTPMRIYVHSFELEAD